MKFNYETEIHLIFSKTVNKFVFLGLKTKMWSNKSIVT